MCRRIHIYPIQVGAALAGKKLPGIRHDDEGDNISDKNKSYCELTAQYWAWKNEEASLDGYHVILCDQFPHHFRL